MILAIVAAAILGIVVVGAIFYVGGFLISMVLAAFFVPIEGIARRHRHHPLPH